MSPNTRTYFALAVVVALAAFSYAYRPADDTAREPPKPRLTTELIQGVGVLKNGYLMCVSEKALSESYAIRQAKQYDMLESIGCFRTNDQISGVVTDWGFAVTEVRIKVPGKGTALVYVQSEALGKREVLK